MTNFKKELAEHAILHSKNCCVHFEDGRACDAGDMVDNCCENITIINNLFRKYAVEIIDFISHDLKIEKDIDRQLIVKFYKDHFNL